MSMAKLRFFSPEMLQSLAGHVPFEDLGLNREKLRRWHPLNRELCLGARAQLAGLLLAAKGDRVAMHSSVETRYPFLDEEVFSFIARLHPRWKLRGLRDKFLLRKLGLRCVPPRIALRRKAMFRAPFDSFHLENAPPYVEQLLSGAALRKTGYFNPEAVRHWRQAYRGMWLNRGQRVSIEMGLVGVLATQLWHQTFIDSSLADLPSWSASAPGANGAWRAAGEDTRPASPVARHAPLADVMRGPEWVMPWQLCGTSGSAFCPACWPWRSAHC